MGKEEIKLLFSDDMITYVENKNQEQLSQFITNKW